MGPWSARTGASRKNGRAPGPSPGRGTAGKAGMATPAVKSLMMRTRLLASLALLGLAATAAPAAAATARPSSARPGPSVPAGLPSDVPPAAVRPLAVLPPAAGWPGPDGFPRTAGTGRLDAGGFYWTDWIYDDHGALSRPGVPGAPGADPAEQGAPSYGDYTYPPGPAQANGADIFRAAVFLTGSATVWRVDWNTLVDPRV